MTEVRYIDASDLDLSDLIRPGDHVVCGQASGEPTTLTEVLVSQRANFGPISVFLGLSLSESFKPEHSDYITFNSFGPMGKSRALMKAGVLNITPVHYGLIDKYIRDDIIPCDVALVSLTPPGPDGQYGFGLINDYIRAAIDKARVVIGEVNHQIPWVHSDGVPDIGKFTAIIETSRAPLIAAPVKTTPEDKIIAGYIARYIEDGSVLQIGVGAIPEALGTAIKDRRNLGFHSGIAGDFLVDLMEKGIIDNSSKPFDHGTSVTAILLGRDKLYSFAKENKAIKLRPTWHTHSGDLYRLNKLVSVNSALEVDLSGQVGAEAIDGEVISAVGGQPDLVRAAHRSTGGHAIIALPSTARKGELSRIVNSLSGPVTTARSDVDVVITEYGIADLRGKNLTQRAKELINIAAPKHKTELLKNKTF